MKKLVLQFMFLTLMLPFITHATVYIGGTITDSSNNNPISNHAVAILSDSSFGYIYYNVVYTNSNGFYMDTVPAPAGSSGVLFIQTWDCNNVLHQATINYNPSNTSFTQDFQICNSNSPCQADFTYYFSGTLTVQYTDLSSGGNGPWDWNFGDGSTSTLQNPSHSYANPGQYVVTLAYGVPNTNCYDTKSTTIYLNDTTGGGCNAAFYYISDSTNTPPYTYQFIDQSTGNITSWAWDFGDPNSGSNNTSNFQNPVHIFSGPGNYLVCLTIQGADSSCYDFTCKAVVTGNEPGCQAMFTYNSNPAFGAYAIQFTDQSTGNPQSWYWNFSDSAYSTQQNPLHEFSGPGSYQVCLTIAGNNCTSTYCQDVLVQDSSAYHQIYGQVFHGIFPTQFSVVLIFSLDTTQNYNPYIDVSITDSNGIYFFTLVPDGNYLIYAIPLYLLGYLPTYYGDVLNWEQATVIELGEPTNPYDIHLIETGQSMPQGPGSVAGLINNSSIRISMMDKVIMLLLDNDGKAISFKQVDESGFFEFSPMDYGTYYLHPELSGITSGNMQVILTPERPHVDVVMTFDGKSILGLNDEKQTVEAGTVYPNPMTEKFSLPLNLASGMNLKFEIFNQMGQLVSVTAMSLGPGQKTLPYSVTGLGSGIYTLRITSEKGFVVTKKLIITR